MDVTAHRFQRSIAGQVLVVTELTALAAAPTTAMSGDPYYGAHTGNCGVLVKKQATDARRRDGTRSRSRSGRTWPITLPAG